MSNLDRPQTNEMQISIKWLLGFILILAYSNITKLHSQSFLNILQLNGGLASAPVSDVYVGKLDYLPQFRLADDKFRLGANVGGFYSYKKFNVAGGLNSTLRLKNISMLNNNYSLGGIYLRVGHAWGSDQQKIINGSLLFEFTQIGINFTYGRDYHFNNNWFSYGFAFMFSKPQTDEDE